MRISLLIFLVLQVVFVFSQDTIRLSSWGNLQEDGYYIITRQNRTTSGNIKDGKRQNLWKTICVNDSQNFELHYLYEKGKLVQYEEFYWGQQRKLIRAGKPYCMEICYRNDGLVESEAFYRAADSLPDLMSCHECMYSNYIFKKDVHYFYNKKEVCVVQQAEQGVDGYQNIFWVKKNKKLKYLASARLGGRQLEFPGMSKKRVMRILKAAGYDEMDYFF